MIKENVVERYSKAAIELKPEHPSYSPDLVPNDYQPFSKLKKLLRGKRFSLDNDVIWVMNQWFVEVE